MQINIGNLQALYIYLLAPTQLGFHYPMHYISIRPPYCIPRTLALDYPNPYKVHAECSHMGVEGNSRSNISKKDENFSRAGGEADYLCLLVVKSTTSRKRIPITSGNVSGDGYVFLKDRKHTVRLSLNIEITDNRAFLLCFSYVCFWYFFDIRLACMTCFKWVVRSETMYLGLAWLYIYLLKDR